MREYMAAAAGQQAVGSGTREKTEVYRELTMDGKLVCALAGLIEEAAVFLALHIRVGICPVPVVLFLWFLFAVLTGAVMIGADELRSAVLTRKSCRRYRMMESGEAKAA